MNPLRPIEIVGGGLAGLALGRALRRSEVPVTLYESGDYPRHRVCGEFITGLSERTIAALDLGPVLHDALQLRDLLWHHGEVETRRQRLPHPALGLSRHALDARLAAAYIQSGGVLHTRSRVTDKTAAAGRVFTIGRRVSDSSWIGLKFHARKLSLGQDLELHLADEAYVGMSPVENGRVNICGLFRRRAIQEKGPALLLAYLRATGLAGLASRLAAADPDPESCCAVAGVAFDARVAPGERLELGDASAVIPPFTGNGMAMAWQSAEMAVGPLLLYSRGELGWAEAVVRIQGAAARRFRVRLACAAVLHPFFWRPSRQGWLAQLARARLVPLRPLYTVLH